ncbi:hypothetical protein J6590_099107, partial [Homalodisca vitripennis]
MVDKNKQNMFVNVPCVIEFQNAAGNVNIAEDATGELCVTGDSLLRLQLNCFIEPQFIAGLHRTLTASFPMH